MTSRRHRTVAALAAVLIAVTLAGCGGDSGAESAADESAADGSAVDRGAAPEAAPEREQPGEEREPGVGKPARAVVHTGTLRLEVKAADKSADEAIEITRDAEGFVGRDERSRTGGAAEAIVELRIPAEAFAATLKRISKLGKELEREISAEDVSEELIDLDSRIESMRASVKRTRKLLERAETISDISSVERELTSRESDLASLEARKRALANKVDFSTLTLHLGEKTPAPPPPAEVGFMAGVDAGWYAFKVTVRVVLTIVGAMLPFLIALAVPVLGVLVLLRWRRRRTRAALVDPGTGATPP
ncbi:MAG: DUF4349 domain-containing protein, partial [Micromonosporaceae bacterium]